ncbi:MAG TPA: DUF6603 domain-containing protein [Pyrinomonadaceae bacterium]|jgi:hypothetical protein
MSAISIPSGALDKKLVDFGLLVGLLNQPDGKEFNLDWFQDPLPYLKKIPSDAKDMLSLLRDILGQPAAGTPSDKEWYALNWNGTPSGVYIVLPLKSDTSSPATVGIGLWWPFTGEDATIMITGWVFFPLFNLPVSSPVIITGSANYPVTITLDIEDTKETFQVGSGESLVTFTGLEFVGNIYFSDTTPDFTLQFLNMKPESQQSTAKTLADLQNATLANWVNAVLGSQTVKEWLSTNIPSRDKKIGEVLTGLNLLVMTNEQYALGSLSSFETMTPAQIAEQLVVVALSLLASNEKPVFSLGTGGVYIVGEDAAGGTDYGVRLQVEDIQITGSSENGADNNGNTSSTSESGAANQPKFVVQIGKWLTGESDSNNWAGRADSNGKIADPGVTILLVNVKNNTEFSFNPRVELSSLGFDFAGSNDKPLFDIQGVQLGGVELRFSLSLDFSDLSKILWGGAVRLDHLGLPLGAGVTGSSGNPVAQNLLSSGSGESGGAGADTQPVNPTFSAAVAWLSDPNNPTDVNFQLYAPNDTPTDTVWIPVQRAFGPLQCQRLGVEWPQTNPDLRVSFLFDGDVALGGLEIDLKGLSIGIPLKSPGDLGSYELGLDGLDITFSQGPVEVSGGLFKAQVKVDGQDIIEYNGEALIKAANWSITALGSWATLNGHPSLFIFAFLNAPIGGPAFFFVTGLSAGFGYNRSLTLPKQDEVQDFPFVAGLTDPAKIGGADAGPQEALQAIQNWVQPAQGVNWIAAGVQFTSFELINSNALVVVEFGDHFEIAVLGLSRIKLPQAGPVTYAYIELGLEVIIDPADGLFSATAVITPNSYVIDPACHLTGGFAFYVWFGDNPHAGDFVLTIGGYHPQFKKPEWYPDEPRLGFNWQVSDQVTIKGDAYFALTPSCVMGGGSLDLQFQSGNLAAWFTAYADFLIQWKPFYYTADIGISIGVSYRVNLLFVTKTIKVELGADLNMWGPPTGGEVHVHLWIVSFTVSFGPAYGQGNDYLEFSDFKTLLPQDKPQSQPAPMMKAAKMALAAEDDAPPFQNVVKLIINAGQYPQPSPDGRWLVRADEFTFSVETAWPLTELDLEGPSSTTQLEPPTLVPPDKNAPACARSSDGYYVGVRPMGIVCTTSVLSMTVTFDGSAKQDVNADWTWDLNTRSVPEATWGQPVPKSQTPAAEANTLPGRLTGLKNIKPKVQQPSGPDPIPIANLSYDPVNPDAAQENYLPIPQPAQAGQPQVSATSLQTIASTIMQDSAPNSPVSNRAAIFNALAGFGYDAGTNGDLSALVSYINLSYSAPPMLESPVGQ